MERRQNLAASYRAALPPGYAVQEGLSDGRSMPYRFVVRAPNEAARDRLHQHLKTSGVAAIVPLTTRELLHRLLGLSPARFPRAEHISATTLSVPLYPALLDDEAAHIVEALKKAPQP
jgi:dTDP-4-amino-4,6-dideoxygalactose transaminase